MASDDEKAARLAAALRANLQRRKAQVRARTASQAPAAPGDAPEPGSDSPREETPAVARAERAQDAPPLGVIVPDDEAG